MQVILFVAADYANISIGNKLNIMGIFGEINASVFPARCPSMHLVVKLLAELGEYGYSRNFTIRLIDPDGQMVMEMMGDFDVPQIVEGKRPEIVAIIGLQDVVFPKPGPFQFVFLVDRDHKSSLSIYVNEIKSTTS